MVCIPNHNLSSNFWVVFVSRKIRNSGSVDDDGTQLVIADAYNESADTISRRERALDIGKSLAMI